MLSATFRLISIYGMSNFQKDLESPTLFYNLLHNNKINAHALIGQSAMGYCADTPMEKSCVF